MTPEDTTSPSLRTKVALPPSLDIAAAADLKRALLEALAAEGNIDVDASAVQRIATPCLQILAAAANSIEPQSDRRFRLYSVPDPLCEAIERLGLAPALGTEEG